MAELKLVMNINNILIGLLRSEYHKYINKELTIDKPISTKDHAAWLKDQKPLQFNEWLLINNYAEKDSNIISLDKIGQNDKKGIL
jgi:hypothetical protein